MSDEDTDRRFERIEAQLARLEAKLDLVLEALGAQVSQSTRPTTDDALPVGGKLFEPGDLDASVDSLELGDPDETHSR